MHLGLHPRLNREITFADEVVDSGASRLDRVPAHADVSKHIQILQRQQQNAKNGGGTLRIPGPKDFDNGEVAEELEDSNDNVLHRPQTRNTFSSVDSEIERGRRRASDDRTEELNGDDHPPKQAITFNEPEHHPNHREQKADEPPPMAESSTLGRIRSRLSRRRSLSRVSEFPSKASFAKTWSNLTSSNSMKITDPSPYLDFAATIGRNSQFIGLSEEQREVLGGIEYRSLKTLSKVLIGLLRWVPPSWDDDFPAVDSTRSRRTRLEKHNPCGRD